MLDTAITPTGTAPAGAHLATSAQFGIANETDVFVVESGGSTQVSWVQSVVWQGRFGSELRPPFCWVPAPVRSRLGLSCP
jgi:hypothetical protein